MIHEKCMMDTGKLICKRNLYLINFIRIVQILYLFQEFLEK